MKTKKKHQAHQQIINPHTQEDVFKKTCHMVFLNTWETDNGYLWQLHGGQCEHGIGSMVKRVA